MPVLIVVAVAEVDEVTGWNARSHEGEVVILDRHRGATDVLPEAVVPGLGASVADLLAACPDPLAVTQTDLSLA